MQEIRRKSEGAEGNYINPSEANQIPQVSFQIILAVDSQIYQICEMFYYSKFIFMFRG